MWEDLLNFGEGAWESVSEGASQYVDGLIDLEVSKSQEQAKDPEVLNLAEPEKAVRTDGSTIVAAPVTQQTLITGVDNTVLLVGGAFLMVGMVLLARRT